MQPEGRRQHRGTNNDTLCLGQYGSDPGGRKRRMTVGVLPRLEMIADKYRVEPGLFGLDGEFEQSVGRELFGRSLVSEAHIFLLSQRRNILLLKSFDQTVKTVHRIRAFAGPALQLMQISLRFGQSDTCQSSIIYIMRMAEIAKLPASFAAAAPVRPRSRCWLL